MSRLFNRVFGCSQREKDAEDSMKRREMEHVIAVEELDVQLDAARKAARESRSAARTLLRNLSEDIPK